MFGCCGFLSFSWVFCKFGGRLETTLYIHFTRRWKKSTRHSSARRENEDEKKAGKTRHSSQLGFVGSGLSAGRADPADHLSFYYVLGQPPFAQGVYRLSDGGYGNPPRLCARRGRATAPIATSTVPISASLRRVRSRVRRRSPTLLCRHRYAATASTSLSIRRRRVGWVETSAGVRPVGVR